MNDRTWTAGDLTGAAIAGVFGLAWTEWGASGLSGAASIVVRIVGIVIGVAIAARSMRVRAALARPADSPGSMFASRGYLLTVLAEVIALGLGGFLLGRTGNGAYVIAWFATVVGVHFVVFGRLFWSGFYWLGGTLIAAAVAGTVVGITGGGAHLVIAVTGLISALALFVAGGRTVLLAGGGLRRRIA